MYSLLSTAYVGCNLVDKHLQAGNLNLQLLYFDICNHKLTPIQDLNLEGLMICTQIMIASRALLTRQFQGPMIDLVLLRSTPRWILSGPILQFTMVANLLFLFNSLGKVWINLKIVD